MNSSWPRGHRQSDTGQLSISARLLPRPRSPQPADLNRLKRPLVFKMGRVGRGLPPRLICQRMGSAGGSRPPRRAHFSVWTEDIRQRCGLLTHSHPPASSSQVGGRLAGVRLHGCPHLMLVASRSCVCKKPAGGCRRAVGFL